MFRVSMVKNYRFNENFSIGSPLDFILRIGEKFPVFVLGECLYSVRILRDSLSRRNPNESLNKLWDIKYEACKRRGLDPIKYVSQIHTIIKSKGGRKGIDSNVVSHFIHSVKDFRKAGMRWKAILTGLQCIKLQPFDFNVYKAIIYAFCPIWFIK